MLSGPSNYRAGKTYEAKNGIEECFFYILHLKFGEMICRRIIKTFCVMFSALLFFIVRTSVTSSTYQAKILIDTLHVF